MLGLLVTQQYGGDIAATVKYDLNKNSRNPEIDCAMQNPGLSSARTETKSGDRWCRHVLAALTVSLLLASRRGRCLHYNGCSASTTMENEKFQK